MADSVDAMYDEINGPDPALMRWIDRPEPGFMYILTEEGWRKMTPDESAALVSGVESLS